MIVIDYFCINLDIFQVSPNNVGFYCFLVAFLFVLLSLVMFMMVQTTSYFRHHAGTGDTGYRDMASDHNTTTAADIRSALTKCWKYVLRKAFIGIVNLLASHPSNKPNKSIEYTAALKVTCRKMTIFICYVERLTVLLKQFAVWYIYSVTKIESCKLFKKNCIMMLNQRTFVLMSLE